MCWIIRIRARISRGIIHSKSHLVAVNPSKHAGVSKLLTDRLRIATQNPLQLKTGEFGNAAAADVLFICANLDSFDLDKFPKHSTNRLDGLGHETLPGFIAAEPVANLTDGNFPIMGMCADGAEMVTAVFSKDQVWKLFSHEKFGRGATAPFFAGLFVVFVSSLRHPSLELGK
jgi:hypothetical protein